MNIEIKKNTEEIIIEVAGRLDTTTAPDFNKAVTEDIADTAVLLLRNGGVHLPGAPAHHHGGDNAQIQDLVSLLLRDCGSLRIFARRCATPRRTHPRGGHRSAYNLLYSGTFALHLCDRAPLPHIYLT